MMDAAILLLVMGAPAVIALMTGYPMARFALVAASGLLAAYAIVALQAALA